MKEQQIFNVYKWHGFLILANSTVEAQELWEAWPDHDKYGQTGNDELFPVILKRVRTEAEKPCIITDLYDWDVVYEYEYEYSNC